MQEVGCVEVAFLIISYNRENIISEWETEGLLPAGGYDENHNNM